MCLAFIGALCSLTRGGPMLSNQGHTRRTPGKYRELTDR